MKSFVSPQLPYWGKRWPGDPAVSAGREPHRLVKRGKIHGFPSFLKLQRMEGGRASVLSFCSVSKVGMWLRAESTKAASDQNLPAFSRAPAMVLCPLHSLGEHLGKPWRGVDIADSNSGIWGPCLFSYFNPSCLWWTFPLVLYLRNKSGVPFYSQPLQQQVGSLSFLLTSKHSEEASSFLWRLWASSLPLWERYCELNM